MRNPNEIRKMIADNFPKMSEAQLNGASTESMAVYILSRLLDNVVETYAGAIGALHNRIKMLEESGAAPQAVAPSGGGAPAQEQSYAPQPANPRVNVHSPESPGNPEDDAAWVMGAIDTETKSEGYDPFAPGAAAPPHRGDPLANAPMATGDPAGVPRTVPAAGQPPLPPEILAAMAETARKQEEGAQAQAGGGPAPAPAATQRSAKVKNGGGK